MKPLEVHQLTPAECILVKAIPRLLYQDISRSQLMGLIIYGDPIEKLVRSEGVYGDMVPLSNLEIMALSQVVPAIKDLYKKFQDSLHNEKTMG